MKKHFPGRRRDWGEEQLKKQLCTYRFPLWRRPVCEETKIEMKFQKETHQTKKCGEPRNTALLMVPRTLKGEDKYLSFSLV